MKKNNILILISLLALMVSCVIAQRSITLEELRNMKKNTTEVKEEKKDAKTKVPKDMEAPIKPGMEVSLDEAETLAEGSQSNMEKPFIFVARTKEDYAMLKKLITGFSSEKEIDFNKQAVIAAFAGTKNTGGYSISIYQMQGRTNVIVKKPSEDAMVTQVLTQPYKVAVVSIEEQASLDLAISEEFQDEITTYKVTSGEFEFSGGFIGRQHTFAPQGTIGVMKSGDYVTFAFNLTGKGDDSERKLSEMASGKMKKGSANINRLEAGNFIDLPHPPLDVTAQMKDNKLSMKFEPGKRNYVVNDGYEGRGRLEAVKQH